MFERYTELARRVIFFARYEASNFGSPYIEPEHLLLGLLREDQLLRSRLPSGGIEQIRKRIEENNPRREKTSTSVDLPLSTDAKRSLDFGAQESTELNHKVIDCGHLVLGLLRLENSVAAAALQQAGIDGASYRDVVSGLPLPRERNLKNPRRIRPDMMRAIDRLRKREERAATKSVAPSLQDQIDTLADLVDATVDHISEHSEAYGENHLKRKPWSRKQAFGHLIDWATAHQHWFARALTEPKVVADGYPPDEWVSAQQYGKFAWEDVVDLWLLVNRLLIHVLAQIPEERLKIPFHIGIEEPIPLAEVVNRYIAHYEDVVGQILARL
jgi:Clp amino terminal domain, pathogenicity island component